MDRLASVPDTPVRVFAAVAIRLSPALLDFCAALAGIGKAIRVTRPEQLHVTLKFYGDVPEAGLTRLSETIEQVAGDAAPFNWRLLGTGAFPSLARPRVIWAGAESGDAFARLAGAIEAAGESLGFAREARPFHPHVTLGRVRFRPSPTLFQLLQKTADQDFGPQRAEQIILFRSNLGREGSTYSPLVLANFGKPEGR